jgi:hypothetical protein
LRIDCAADSSSADFVTSLYRDKLDVAALLASLEDTNEYASHKVYRRAKFVFFGFGLKKHAQVEFLGKKSTSTQQIKRQATGQEWN